MQQLRAEFAFRKYRKHLATVCGNERFTMMGIYRCANVSSRSYLVSSLSFRLSGL